MINGVGCSTGAASGATGAATAADGPNRAAEREQMLSSTADFLKMSATDLKAKLQSGASLDDIAKAQGVSHDDLVANIASNLKSHGGGAANQSDASLPAMAERIAGHHRGQGHHRVHQAPAADTSSSGSSPGSAKDVPTAMSGGSLLDVRA
jgi:hypothetical protein